MKKVLFMLVALVALSGCKNEKDGKLDPNAKVYINGKDAPQSAPQSAPSNTPSKADAAQQKLTIRQVIEQTTRLTSNFIEIGIDDWNRDLVNNRIQGASTWVIAQSGELSTELLVSRDIILVTKNEQNRPKDTIAYLPNSVVIEAEKKIRAAYDAKDYNACYKLFEEALIFIPTTGKEWLELKKLGKN